MRQRKKRKEQIKIATTLRYIKTVRHGAPGSVPFDATHTVRPGLGNAMVAPVETLDTVTFVKSVGLY